MPYTLAAAAAACGVNKSTVLRAIKSGKVSGTKDVNGMSSPPSFIGCTRPLRMQRQAPMRCRDTQQVMQRPLQWRSSAPPRPKNGYPS